MSIIRLDRVDNFQVDSVQVNEVILNGYLLQLGGVVANNRDLRHATKPVDVTKGGLVFHASPEIDADPRKQGLKDFSKEANTPARTYRFAVGSQITVTADAFETLPVVGDIVAPKNGSFKFAESLGTETLQFEVMTQTVLGFEQAQAFELEVVKSDF